MNGKRKFIQMKQINNSKFKIGILLQDFKMNKFESEIINLLNKEKNIDLYAIYENKKNTNIFKKIFFIFKKNSIYRNFEIIFFKLVFSFEKFFLTFFFKDLKDLSNNFSVDKYIFKKIIHVKPIYSSKGIFSEYNDDDHNKIISEKLDLVVRTNSYEIFRNNKLNISRLGIISFHHGDNSWNRGGPPGFWETYLKKTQTGFIIQILNNKLDNGKILLKGEFATKRFYILNQHNLLKESNYFLLDLIKDLLSGKTGQYIQNQYTSSKIFKIPSINITLKYVFVKLWLVLRLIIKKFILRQNQRWHVSYSRSNFSHISFKNSKKIHNLDNRYFADPFAVYYQNKHFIFVEDYSFINKKGSISVIEVDNNDNQKIYENIISETFHLSFPFVFKYENIYYMIPESSEDNCIKLYKCKHFPDKWEFSHNLISNIFCADTIMLNTNSKYFLITSEGKFNDLNSRLNIFFSDNPIGKNWIPHKLNPIYFNINDGRNGGLIINENKIFRVSQKFGINYLGDNQYGNEISIRSIENITSEKFEETIINEIKPIFKKKLLGIHSMSGIDDFTVYDYCKYD